MYLTLRERKKEPKENRLDEAKVNIIPADGMEKAVFVICRKKFVRLCSFACSVGYLDPLFLSLISSIDPA